MPQCVQQAVGLLFTANSPAAKAALGILTESGRDHQTGPGTAGQRPGWPSPGPLLVTF